MKAIILQINEVLETNIALVYKSVFIGETATLLKKMGIQVKVCDVTIEGYDLLDILNIFIEKPELVIMVVDIHQSKISKRVAEYCKLISSKTRIIVIGRATSFIPHYFERTPFDAVHINGDRESALINYVKYMKRELPREKVANISIIENNVVYRSNYIDWLEPELWCVPDLNSLPITQYNELNNKQHPERKLILGVTSTKGCPFSCKYCGASKEEGKNVRYGIPERIINWGNSLDFDFTLQLWSPNFMSSKEWLRHFITAYEKKNGNFNWRGVARLSSIEDEKIKLIQNHNCKEIAVGVEMIKADTYSSLKADEKHFRDAIELCKKYDINLKCLLMLGYPGYTIDDICYTIKLLKKNNLNYRITGYTPLHQLTQLTVKELDATPLEKFDRRTYYGSQIIPSDIYYKILITNGECLI